MSSNDNDGRGPTDLTEPTERLKPNSLKVSPRTEDNFGELVAAAFGRYGLRSSRAFVRTMSEYVES
jgi:hypothetical protein